MKILHCLVAFALTCGLSSVAKASPVSFQMVVIDPPPLGYTVNVITNTAFSFSFSSCVAPGQIPLGTPFVGCFTGQNETGQLLTSLQIAVPPIPGFVAGCAPSGTGLDLFLHATCSGDDVSGYILNFTGGAITDHELFTIAEAYVDPSAFPQVSAVFNTTPEPGSIWLFATGILAGGGLLLADTRRRNALLSRI